MDVEKLIEQLNGYFEGKELGRGAALDAATALSTFQAENEKLRADLEQVRESLDFARTKDAEILRLGMELGHLKKHMERLTYKLGNGEITCNMARDDCRKMGGDCQIDSKILESLAAYEATGLEPKEVAKMAAEWTQYETAMSYVDEIGINRLRELARADREGRCVVLPCQPGDKISYISSAGFRCNAVIDDYTPENIFITAETEIPNTEPLSHTFSILEIEAALRREQNG